jgi:hypothetical protein
MRAIKIFGNVKIQGAEHRRRLKKEIELPS